MNILVTGSGGFIGKNLIWTLKEIQSGNAKSFSLNITEIYQYDKDSSSDELKRYTKDCDFVVHLAGVNRSNNTFDFYSGNAGTIELLCAYLKLNNNRCPIMISSSIHADQDNDYGKSKRQGEDYLRQFSRQHGNNIFIYRFANIFGKWSKPNYNSVIATWCYQIARGLDIVVNDENSIIPFVYIDDVVREIINCINGQAFYDNKNGYYSAKPIYNISLKKVKETLYSFYEQRKTLLIPDLSNRFISKLYSTYLSYLPEEKIIFPLSSNIDERGSFTEILKSESAGQFSINISKPGIKKGEHFHHSKFEFFIVLKGEALIEMRNINSDEVLKFRVSSKDLKVVVMLPGYTHNIINLSLDEELITLMWANEIFDKEKPDTYYETVERK